MTPTRSRRARGFSSPTAEARGARGHGPGAVAGNQTPLLTCSAGCSCSCEQLVSPWCLSFCPSLPVLCLRQPLPTLFTASTRVTHEAQPPPGTTTQWGTLRLPGAPSSPPSAVPAGGRLHVDVSQFHEETAVTFSQLSDELLWQYIDSGEPMCVSQHPEAAAPPALPPVTPPRGPGRASHVTARASGTLRALDGGRRTGCVSSWTPATGRPPQPAAQASGVAAP